MNARWHSANSTVVVVFSCRVISRVALLQRAVLRTVFYDNTNKANVQVRGHRRRQQQ